MKCLVCYKEADVMFQASTYCQEHFESVWGYLNQKFGSKNIYQMKQECDKQQETKK